MEDTFFWEKISAIEEIHFCEDIELFHLHHQPVGRPTTEAEYRHNTILFSFRKLNPSYQKRFFDFKSTFEAII